jgi:xanthine/uracil/vitamin C permease (AzgA family)
MKLASNIVAHPEQPLPVYGFYIGLLLYAVIGAGIAIALGEQNLRGALFAGIAAPALIASAITGSQDAAAQSGTAQRNAGTGLNISLVSSAYAQDLPSTAIGQDRTISSAN